MELIRRDTDYAIRGLVQLARIGKGPTPCQVIAGACDIPRSFAYKILRRMARAGFVSSRGGRFGGFALRRLVDGLLAQKGAGAATA